MKTLIRATRKSRREIVPIASFEMESFEVRVRSVTRHKPLVTGAALRMLKIQLPSSQSKTILTPIGAAQPAEIFLPSPSPQGLGQMRLRLEARPVDCPAALPSGNLSFRSEAEGQKRARTPANRFSISYPNETTGEN